jgi:hypothetical protein
MIEVHRTGNHYNAGRSEPDFDALPRDPHVGMRAESPDPALEQPRESIPRQGQPTIRARFVALRTEQLVAEGNDPAVARILAEGGKEDQPAMLAALAAAGRG